MELNGKIEEKPPKRKRRPKPPASAAKQKRASPKIPGWSPAQFAKEVDESPLVIRDMVKAKQIEILDVAGRKRIPPREKPRYLALWGKS